MELNNFNPIFQTVKHEKTSKHYNFVSTQDIANRFAEHGWTIHKTSIAHSKKYAGFQKHLMRFVNPSYFAGDYHIELIVTNSHHGSNALVLQLGVYRLVCANGLVLGSTFYQERIRHSGFTYERLDQALINVMLQAPKVHEVINRMKSKNLNVGQINELAREFIAMRLPDLRNVSIDLEKLLTPVREVDAGTDLFTVFNLLQEKVIRGGIKYEHDVEILDKNTGLSEVKTVKRTTKRIKAIDASIKLNEGMFDAALELLQEAA